MPRHRSASVPLVNEDDASAEARRAQAKILERKREQDARTTERQKLRQTVDLDAEARRLNAAHAKALRGKAGETFFPSSGCPECGAPAWFDEERKRMREPLHEPTCPIIKMLRGGRVVPPGRSADVNMTSVSAIANNMRARRSAGERDDD